MHLPWFSLFIIARSLGEDISEEAAAPTAAPNITAGHPTASPLELPTSHPTPQPTTRILWPDAYFRQISVDICPSKHEPDACLQTDYTKASRNKGAKRTTKKDPSCCTLRESSACRGSKEQSYKSGIDSCAADLIGGDYVTTCCERQHTSLVAVILLSTLVPLFCLGCGAFVFITAFSFQKQQRQHRRVQIVWPATCNPLPRPVQQAQYIVQAQAQLHQQQPPPSQPQGPPGGGFEVTHAHAVPCVLVTPVYAQTPHQRQPQRQYEMAPMMGGRPPPVAHPVAVATSRYVT